MNSTTLACAMALLLSVPSALAAHEHSGDPGEQLVLMPLADNSDETAEIRAWQARAAQPNASAQDFERLGWAFVQHARRFLDEGFYALALAAADAAARRPDHDVETLLLRGHALHSLHRFEEAEGVARELVARRGSARDHALLGDVLLERGDLEGAVAAIQVFVDRMPGLESFARVAHLRWLHGDLVGAIAAMREAVRAGNVSSQEPQAWALTRLSGFLLLASRLDQALHVASLALGRLPDYPPALLAKGRALLALDRPIEALPSLRRAADLLPLPEYQWWLADSLRLGGEPEAASRLTAELRATGHRDDPRTTSLFLASTGQDLEKAVRLAEDEMSNRADVHTCDALAWALFRTGHIRDSVPFSRRALSTNVADPRVLMHAGLIMRADGDTEGAVRLLSRASELEAALTPSERAMLHEALSSPLQAPSRAHEAG